MPKLMTIEEAAEELGCGTSNVYRLIKQHGIKVQKKNVVKIERVVRRIAMNHIDIEKLQKAREA